MNIEVTGHQWWWTARYRGGSPSDEFVTTNELHVPVGRPVVVTLRSDDVIHSLWLPNLAGKKDLIPGRTATLAFRADNPGLYRGQCAEFCGLQHAMMAIHVIAEEPAKFEAWQQAQRQPAAEPTAPLAQRGKQVFESASRAMCHAIQGTQANAQRGPDLTHLASRRTLDGAFARHARLRERSGLALFYLFTTMLHTGALGALLTVAPTPWYPVHAARTGALGLDPVEGQQLGGLVMWVPGGVAYLAAGLVLLARLLAPSRVALTPATAARPGPPR